MDLSWAHPGLPGVIVLGRNLPAVDGTCIIIMGYDPRRVPYLLAASRILGPIHENKILQRGETIGVEKLRRSLNLKKIYQPTKE